MAVPDLLTYWMQGDLVGWLTAIMLNLMGELWYGFIMMVGGSLVYILTRNAMYIAILWIVSGVALWNLVPIEARLMVSIFLALGTASGIYLAWFGRKI